MATLDFTKPHVLRNEEEYDAAVERIDAILRAHPEPYTDEWEELRFLAVLVEDYEGEHHPIEPATPQQLVDFMLDQHKMARSDLYDAMGGPSRVSEFFSGTRPLSIGQVKRLRAMFGISADLLIPEGDR